MPSYSFFFPQNTFKNPLAFWNVQFLNTKVIFIFIILTYIVKFSHAYENVVFFFLFEAILYPVDEFQDFFSTFFFLRSFNN